MVGVVSGFYINFYSVQAVNISFALNLFLFSLFVSHFVRSPRVLRGALFAFCVGGLTTLVFYFFGFVWLSIFCAMFKIFPAVIARNLTIFHMLGHFAAVFFFCLVGNGGKIN